MNCQSGWLVRWSWAPIFPLRAHIFLEHELVLTVGIAHCIVRIAA